MDYEYSVHFGTDNRSPQICDALGQSETSFIPHKITHISGSFLDSIRQNIGYNKNIGLPTFLYSILSTKIDKIPINYFEYTSSLESKARSEIVCHMLKYKFPINCPFNKTS